MVSSSGVRRLPPPVVVVLAALIGTFAALILGLLTFGVQATVNPDHVPLAVGSEDASGAAALMPLIQGVAGHGGDQIDWHITRSRTEAVSMLDSKQVYGAVLFSPAQAGLSATVVLSGAVNPNATAIAQPILIGVAAGTKAPFQVVTIHPTSAAGRTLPLAATALLWLTGLAANMVALVLGPRLRGGTGLGRVGVIGVAAGASLLGTGLVVGLGWLWDSSLPIGWDVASLLVLVGLAFALLQAAVLRWVGVAGSAILGPLYLMAPAVAGLPPELINPVYRALLWSWTPFRFSVEGIRSMMFVGGGAPDVEPALLLFAAIALGGLILVSVRRTNPARRLLQQRGSAGIADNPARRSS
jgi:hypothetical protein